MRHVPCSGVRGCGLLPQGVGGRKLALSREWETRGKAGRHASETPKMRVATPSSSNREFPPVLYLSATVPVQLAEFYSLL